MAHSKLYDGGKCTPVHPFLMGDAPCWRYECKFTEWKRERNAPYLQKYLFETDSCSRSPYRSTLWLAERVLTDSVHSTAYSGTTSIELCLTAAVSSTMKLVFHIFSRSKFSMEHQFHLCRWHLRGIWHMSIDLVLLWTAEWMESDKHIKLIGLMTITMKKNNSDQTKGKPWTESVKWTELIKKNIFLM